VEEMPRVIGFGELDWQSVRASQVTIGSSAFEGRDNLPEALVAIDAMLKIYQQHSIEKIGGYYYLYMTLLLDSVYHGRFQQRETVVYDPDGNYNVCLGDGEERPCGETAEFEALLTLPWELQFALKRLSADLQFPLLWEWEKPDYLTIQICEFPRQIRKPTAFINTIARKLSEFAHPTSPSAE
jgi:hypothetical protein